MVWHYPPAHILQIQAASTSISPAAPPTPLYAYRAHGNRIEQQDAFAAWSLCAPIQDDEMRRIFGSMAKATSLDQNPFWHEGGSTINLASFGAHGITSANIGDSLTVLFTKARGETDIKARTLSTLHTPNNPDEAARLAPFIDAQTHFLMDNKLCATNYRDFWVNLTRALGDHALSPALSDAPDITSVTLADLKLDTLDSAHLVLFTDGVWDLQDSDVCTQIRRSPEKLAHAVHLKGNQDGNYAAHIGQSLFPLGYNDNTTVVSADLKQLAAQKKDVLLAIFDGHASHGQGVVRKAMQAIHEDFAHKQPEIDLRLF